MVQMVFQVVVEVLQLGQQLLLVQLLLEMVALV
jgi:hypothetical protein